MAKKYIVTLTDAERTDLLAVVRKGTTSARKLARARILLLADEGHTDPHIAANLHVGTATIERIRKKFVDGGVSWALTEQPRPGAKRTLDGKQEALLVAITCAPPPDDRPVWTMQLLADKLVDLKVVDMISDETVRRTLKKTSSSHG